MDKAAESHVSRFIPVAVTLLPPATPSETNYRVQITLANKGSIPGSKPTTNWSVATASGRITHSKIDKTFENTVAPLVSTHLPGNYGLPQGQHESLTLTAQSRVKGGGMAELRTRKRTGYCGRQTKAPVGTIFSTVAGTMRAWPPAGFPDPTGRVMPGRPPGHPAPGFSATATVLPGPISFMCSKEAAIREVSRAGAAIRGWKTTRH